MKQFSIILFFSCIATLAQAQSYTTHLQKDNNVKATVKVTHSKEIDELVNGTINQTKSTQQTSSKKQTTENLSTEKKPQRKEVSSSILSSRSDNTEKQNKKNNITKNSPQTENSQEEKENNYGIPTVDLRKKVMVNSYKVNGFRIQVFAGSNTRKDKIKAQNIGKNIKMAFPELPVYVHFYSPSWKCRVGNFRTYEEADEVLRKIKAMGYRQANILKGKITVQY